MSRTRTAPGATSPARVEDADRLYRALARLIRWSRRASVSPLGPGTLAALGTICDSGPLRLGDLAQREGVTPATLSRIVGGLEDDGYIKRSVDPADRRSTFVTATTSGRRLVEDVRALRAAALLDRLRRLDDEQRAALVDALGALEALVEDV
jgi:DNA-binding MarR family transcriptional regulator